MSTEIGFQAKVFQLHIPKTTKCQMENLWVNPVSHGLFQTLLPRGEGGGPIDDYSPRTFDCLVCGRVLKLCVGIVQHFCIDKVCMVPQNLMASSYLKVLLKICKNTSK